MSMAIYLFVFFAILLAQPIFRLIFKKSKNAKAVSAIFCFLVFFILAILKDDSVGIDTQAYLVFYQSVSKGPIAVNYSNFGSLFVLIGSLLGHIGLPFRFFQILIYFVSYGSLSYFAYKTTDNIYLFWIVVMGVGQFYFSLSGIRQFLATAILSLGFLALMSSDKPVVSILKFLIFVAIATLIHKQALIVLLILPFYKHRLNVPLFLISLALMIYLLLFSDMVYAALLSFINTPYQSSSEGLSLTSILYILIACLICLVSLHLRPIDKLFAGICNSKPLAAINRPFSRKPVENSVLVPSDVFQVSLFGLLFTALFYSFATTGSAVTRLSSYFFPLFAISIANFCDYSYPLKKCKRIIIPVIVLTFFITYYVFGKSGGGVGLTGYKLFF